MSENLIAQPGNVSEFPTAEQFRANFKEIFEAEKTFGCARAARRELLENVTDIIQEYLNHDCSIVYLHGKLKEAGYSGSRKELSEWLVSKGMRTKREITAKVDEKSEESENDSGNVSKPDEVFDSQTASIAEAYTPAKDKQNTSSGKNIEHSPNGINPETAKIPGSSVTSSSISSNTAKTVITAKVNTNSVKN